MKVTQDKMYVAMDKMVEALEDNKIKASRGKV